MSKSSEKLAEMFRENTGRHFLDSGDYYGRNWQRNQKRDLEHEVQARLKFDIGTYRDKPNVEIDLTFNTFQWLDEKLTWDEDGNRALKVCERFIRLANYHAGKIDREYVQEDGRWFWAERNGELPSDFELAELFPVFFSVYYARHEDRDLDDCSDCEGEGEVSHDNGDSYDTCSTCKGRGQVHSAKLWWDEKKGFIAEGVEDEAGGIYGEGEPLVINTYNEENLLDQTIQFVYFTLGSEEYVVLQVHGGCDVRGGYTSPQVFSLGGSSELDILDYRRGGIGCSEEGRPEPNPTLTLPKVDMEIPKVEREDYHGWYTDDGSNFYPNNYETQNLEDYPPLRVDEAEWYALAGKRAEAGVLVSDDDIFENDEGVSVAKHWHKNHLCIHPDGRAQCPHCGGFLSGGFY